MMPEGAQALAESVHAGALDRYGSSLIDHVRRVAIAVPLEARAVAWLHEALEYAAVTGKALRAAGASDDEVAALKLLTRDLRGDEAAYLAHITRIARAPGEPGRLARIVKRVDLIDRAAHQAVGSGVLAIPPYQKALDILSRCDPPA
jgi:hypothetical protein